MMIVVVMTIVVVMIVWQSVNHIRFPCVVAADGVKIDRQSKLVKVHRRNIILVSSSLQSVLHTGYFLNKRVCDILLSQIHMLHHGLLP